jgi:L-threonylcarbamoyladenylate synthase
MQHRQTEVLVLDPVHPDPTSIERAAALLRTGEVVVFPTETVYGLGADALQSRAVERIFAAKGRPFSDPLIVHIADEDALEQLTSRGVMNRARTSNYARTVEARQLAKVFWPGPLTLILPRSPLVPKLVTAGLETVAIRMPRHPVALALIRAVGSPIAAPSANRFMHVSPTTAQHALADLSGRVPLILDAGPCEVGVESTVLDLSAAVPTILRPGGISLEALRTVLPQVQLQPRHVELPSEVARRSPGQLLTHYAPAVPLLLFDGATETMRTAMQAEVHRRIERGERVGVLVADEDVSAFQESGAVVQSLGDADAPGQMAAALFARLRALEDADVQIILSRSFDQRGLGLAIRDRLLKAAGGKVFKKC